MRLGWFFLPGLAGVALAGAAQGAEINAREGLYETTTIIEIPGVPAGILPPQVVRQCVTDRDAADLRHFVNQGGGGDGNCEIKNLTQGDHRISFALSCPAQQMAGQGDYVFSGDDFSGQMTLTMPNPAGGQEVTFTARTSAKRVGPCGE